MIRDKVDISDSVTSDNVDTGNSNVVNDNNDDSGGNVGAIVGGVIGGIVGLVVVWMLIAFVVYKYMRKKLDIRRNDKIFNNCL